MAEASVAARAATALARCDALAAYSEEEGRLTRRYGAPALREAMDAVDGWCRAAGMTTRRDAIGNLIARYEGDGSDRRTLLLGSHLDSVRDAGRYDGPLGVLTALACVEGLHARGERLPFAIEVLAFADEEGLRFHTGYLGSQVAVGRFAPALLERVDGDGVTLRAAIDAFGGDAAALAAGSPAHWRREDLLGYCEAHIEQGPALEARGAPVGVMTAIQGMSRATLRVEGRAGHAGTTPPELRRDALAAAAEIVLAAEEAARSTPGLVATVGQIAVEPGASNVIPGLATLSLDMRHPEDDRRAAALAELGERVAAIAARRGVTVTWGRVQESASVACSPWLTDRLRQAVAAQGLEPVALPSGAGHDAVMLARLTEVAMLFVRCAGGVSHHPAEAVTVEDVAVAVAVMDDFVRRLAREVGAA